MSIASTAAQFPFIGNGNIVVSSIDTVSNGIVASRTSGELPAFVQVSASGILCSATSANGATVVPYEDLEYSWDFGDPSGVEFFTNPVTGRAVNANHQSGPEAAYVYRTAGTYTITLTVRGATTPPVNRVSTGLVKATATMSFTANAFNKTGGEYFFDSVNGSDANNGTSSATPKQSLSALNALMTAGHMQFNLARGSSWVGTTGIYLQQSDMRIAPYGTGANPIIDMRNASDGAGVQGPTFNALSADNTAIGVSNVVVSSLDLRRSGTTPNTIVNCVFGNFPTHNVFDNYFDNLNTYSDVTVNTSKWFRYQYPERPTVTSNIQRMGIWGGSINESAASLSTDAAEGIYGGSFAWNFFVGISPFTSHGDVAAPGLAHHVYMDAFNHGLFRWINFGAGLNLDSNIKISANSLSGSYELGSYWLISENHMNGTFAAIGIGNSAGLNLGLSDVQNIVIQSNAFHDFSKNVVSNGAILSETFRFNNIWNISTAAGIAMVGVNNSTAMSTAEIAVNFKAYGNNVYRNISSSQTSGVSPFCQKALGGTGTATWDNGSGSSGNILTVTAYSGGNVPNITAGQMPLFAPTANPGNGVIQAYGTGSTTGTGGTGTYQLATSALVASAGFQTAWAWTTPWTITDNIIYDTSTTPCLMDLQFANQSGATVNRNQWYAPNGHLTAGDQTGTPFFDNRFAKTFAQLKAAGFGTNDTVANPNWVDPANGVFAP